MEEMNSKMFTKNNLNGYWNANKEIRIVWITLYRDTIVFKNEDFISQTLFIYMSFYNI